jgi:uncharacterized tellurite resistance protein B-like protein
LKEAWVISERLEKNFRLLAAAAWADGQVGDEELAVLLDVARDQEITPDDARRLIAEAQKDGGRDYTSDLPPGEADRAFLFILLVRVVGADGVLDPKELAFLKKLGPAFGYKEAEVEMVAKVACDDANEASKKKK